MRVNAVNPGVVVSNLHRRGGMQEDAYEKFLEHDPPRPEELVACLSITEAHLDDVAREMPDALEARCFVGLAGTVSTAATPNLNA